MEKRKDLMFEAMMDCITLLMIVEKADWSVVAGFCFCTCFSHGAASGLDVTMEGSHSVTHSLTQSLSHSLSQTDRQSWDITLASAITLV